ncbi:MAG: DinB family protein [Propionibacteriaceae bacterium]|nr:DinB family protein [Propionibacteriaceae bacterium]
MSECQPPPQGDERATVLGFLDFLRGAIERKTAGFSDDELRRALPPSSMTLGGMLTHLAFVEDYWLKYVFLGERPTDPWAEAPWEENSDWDWELIGSVSGDEARAMWRDAVERSREIVAAAESLDAVAANPSVRTRTARSLRYILVHLVEEYGRHAGHADLLAQALDGRTGE